MKRFYVLLFLSLSLSSCFSNYFKVDPKFTDNTILISNESTKKIFSNIEVNLDWQGNAYPIETSKNLAGIPTRFVIPYTRNTTLFKLKILNNSDNYIKIDPDKIILKTSHSNNEFKPLSIDFFKKKWPSFAVKTQEMLIDQSVAIGEIIRTIVKDASIMPHSTINYYIPFKKIDGLKDATIKMIIFVDNQEKELTFEFKKK